MSNINKGQIIEKQQPVKPIPEPTPFQQPKKPLPVPKPQQPMKPPPKNIEAECG